METYVRRNKERERESEANTTILQITACLLAIGTINFKYISRIMERVQPLTYIFDERQPMRKTESRLIEKMKKNEMKTISLSTNMPISAEMIVFFRTIAYELMVFFIK